MLILQIRKWGGTGGVLWWYFTVYSILHVYKCIVTHFVQHRYEYVMGKRKVFESHYICASLISCKCTNSFKTVYENFVPVMEMSEHGKIDEFIISTLRNPPSVWPVATTQYCKVVGEWQCTRPTAYLEITKCFLELFKEGIIVSEQKTYRYMYLIFALPRQSV